MWRNDRVLDACCRPRPLQQTPGAVEKCRPARPAFVRRDLKEKALTVSIVVRFGKPKTRNVPTAGLPSANLGCHKAARKGEVG